MKKGVCIKALSFFVAISVLLILDAKGIKAGDYHIGETLVCSTCHVMHYSITHEAHSMGIIDKMGTAGPYKNLLRDEVNNLCLICHDKRAGGAYGWPDVLEGPSNSSIIRQAGMLNKLSSPSPYEHWKGHTLGSTSTAPGGTFSNPNGLNCIDCHMPHGNVAIQYRNLWISDDLGNKFYNKSITYGTGMNNLSKDVFQRTPSSFSGSSSCSGCHKIHITGLRYDISDISFNQPVPTKSAFGDWCKSCHGDFHGKGGDPNMGGKSGGDVNSPWLRHPTTDVSIGANSNAHSSYPRWSGLTYRVQTMSNSGTYPAADNTPFCLSCHRGHGSVNPFSLVFTNNDGTLAIENTGAGASIANTCKQCHNK